MIDKITIKENGLNITPADSSTIVDGSLGGSETESGTNFIKRERQ